MGLETFTYISSFNSANPVSSDNASQGDDHIRGMKTAILATFPNITGAVTPTHTELNYVDGVTSAIQTQIDGILDGYTATGALKSSSGGIHSYGIAADNNQGAFYFRSDALAYLHYTTATFNFIGGAVVADGLLKGNGGGSGLGQVTISTSAASGGSAGDLWLRY